MNKIKEMIKNVFNNNKILTARELIIFFVISFVFSMVWIINIFDNILDFSMSIYFFNIVLILLLYLPLVIILLFKYLIQKFKIENIILLKTLRVIINIFSFIYYFLFLLYFLVIYSMFSE